MSAYFTVYTGLKAGNPRGIDVMPALNRARMALLGAVQQNFTLQRDAQGRPWPPLRFPRPNSRGQDIPLQSTGMLQASIFSAINASKGSVTVGSNLPYAALHQHGGTITPKRGKFLAIPKTAQAQRAGSPRRYPGKLVFVGNDHAGALVDATTSAAQFALVKQVTVPARPFLHISPDTEEEIAEIISEYVAEVMP